MPFSVHLGYTPGDDALNHLREKLLPDITLTHGSEPPPDADYRLLVAGRPTREQLTASPNLEIMLIPFAGLPAVTAETMQDFPQIAIHNLHHNAPPTAEMAVGLLLAAAKLIVPSDRDFRRHDWTPRYQPYPSVLLHGKTALILGYGAVGQRVGTILEAMGMRVLGVRRRDVDPTNDIHPPDALTELLPRAHVLMICLPGTPQTEGMIGANELSKLPQGAVVVNVGRAVVVDPGALYTALKDGHLHAAAQDVWYTYPPDVDSRTNTPPVDVPLYELDNMVMSPHRAGAGANAEIELMRMAALAEVINMAARGEPLSHRVSLEAGY